MSTTDGTDSEQSPVKLKRMQYEKELSRLQKELVLAGRYNWWPSK